MIRTPNKLAQPNHVFDCLSRPFAMEAKEVILYARFLREGGQRWDLDLWPTVTPGRGIKFEIKPHHVAHLLIALATSPAAATAVEYVRYYSFLAEIESAAALASLGLHELPVNENSRLFVAIAQLIEKCDDGYSLTFFTTSFMAQLSDGTANFRDFAPSMHAEERLPGGIALTLSDHDLAVQRACKVPGRLLQEVGRRFESR